MLIAQKRLKLWTSNLTCVFPGTVDKIQLAEMCTLAHERLLVNFYSVLSAFAFNWWLPLGIASFLCYGRKLNFLMIDDVTWQCQGYHCMNRSCLVKVLFANGSEQRFLTGAWWPKSGNMWLFLFNLVHWWMKNSLTISTPLASKECSEYGQVKKWDKKVSGKIVHRMSGFGGFQRRCSARWLFTAKSDETNLYLTAAVWRTLSVKKWISVLPEMNYCSWCCAILLRLQETNDK